MKGLRLRPLGETMPPAVAMGLPLEVIPSLVVGCFFGTMTFLRMFWGKVWHGRNLSIRTQILMKGPVCDRDFPPWAIGQSIYTTSEIRESEVCKWDKIIYNKKERHMIFTWKPLIGKNHGERKLQELQKLFARVSVMGLIGRKEDPKASPSSLEKVNLCLTTLCLKVDGRSMILETAWFAVFDLL